jgi:hypothetical protein
MVDTRELERIWTERQKLQSDVSLENGYQALKSERHQIEQLSKLDFNSIHDNSSEKSRLFLKVFKHKLENDPAAMKRLIYADSQVRASGVPVDTNEYFASLEEHMGFKPDERRFEFEDRPSTTKRRQAKEPKLSPDQLETARSIGVDTDEYLAAAERTYSFDPKDDSHVYLDPNDSVDTGKNDEPEVRFEGPKQKEVKFPQGYKASKDTVVLNPDEVDLCRNMAASTHRPEREVINEFARQKLALHRGETGYRLHEAKRDQGTPSRHR